MNIIIGLSAALGVGLIVLPSAPRPAWIGWRWFPLALPVGLSVHVLLRIPVIAVLAGLAAVFIPSLQSSRLRARRSRQNAQAWPDLLDALVSSLRAGMALPQALAELDRTAPEPLVELVAPLSQSVREGTRVGSALQSWRDQCADPTVDRIAMSLGIATGVGGRALPLVLSNLSGYLRSEARTRAELVARQSWTVNAARLAVAAPWLMVVILGARAREAYQTPTGAAILIAGAAASLVGYLWMRSLARLPEAKRIFA